MELDPFIDFPPFPLPPLLFGLLEDFGLLDDFIDLLPLELDELPLELDELPLELDLLPLLLELLEDFGLLELFGLLDDFIDLLPLELEELPLELEELPLPFDEEISTTSISSSCLASGSSALPFPLELEDPFMDFPPFPFPPLLLDDFGLLEDFGLLDDFIDLLPLEELPLELDELPLPLDEESR